MLYGLLIFVHVIVSIALVVTVLMQSSKGGGLAGTFGGSGVSGGIFGGRGAAPFLVKATTALAVLFMVTSISLNFVSSRGGQGSSVLERTLTQPGMQQPSSEPLVTDEMPLSNEQPASGGDTESQQMPEGDAGEQ